jgi:dihydropteroate synthase
MPKLTPIQRRRNALIKKRFKELYKEGMKKGFIFEKIGIEFFLTPAIVSRIIQPIKFGKRGGKIKSEKEHKEFMRNYNAEKKKKRDELIKSNEQSMKK